MGMSVCVFITHKIIIYRNKEHENRENNDMEECLR